ncbi:PAS domain S-box-containing protein [Blastomonas natatoria]|uniref:histidine kinase n=1 Tax=Blastomonas natatoria TaxID=34015 RepID=A0A2V3UUL9_9SPHN|nr:PAS domain-containing protein [Blastomonas natatoria]PXW71607.1 PAS domain S-box-containing protein [Blastomonas natatoria]
MGDIQPLRIEDATSAAELDALYARAPLGLGLVDRELRFVRVNPALADMNGVPPEAHVGRKVWDLVPDLRATAEPILLRVIESGEPLRDVAITGTTLAYPGQIREWREQFYPIFADTGEVTGIGIICEDVTEQRRQDRELRESEDQLRRVLDQLFAFVGVLTLDGHVDYANRAPLEAAGLALADVVGRPFWDAPWWSYDTAVQDRLKAAVASAGTGQVVRYDVPVQLGDALVTIDFQLAPLRDATGQIAGLIPSGTVIEERVQAERALRALADDLEMTVARRTAALHEANAQLTDEIARREATQDALIRSQKMEAMGRLVAGVAHDFNNILAAVLSGLALIGRRIDDPDALKLVDMSTNAAMRGTGLVKQLLAFARQQRLDPERIDVATFLAELEPLLHVSAGSGISVTIENDGQCGAIMADAAQLQSALLNLVINARDAMPDGGSICIVARMIRVPGDVVGCELADGDYAAISVIDNGSGMTPEVLARVAEPFFTTKQPGKGTGLGVSMVHGFTHQSGGGLAIESEPGKGTAMTLFLPRLAEGQGIVQ